MLVIHLLDASQSLGMTRSPVGPPKYNNPPRVGFSHRMYRPTLPRITTKLSVPRPRQLVPHKRLFLFLRNKLPKIGRKHKAHRQQLAQDKPWRETEKGRGKGRGKRKGKQSRMGNEESRIIDPSTPTQTLSARTVQALAQYIKDGRAKKIVVMVRITRDIL